MATITAAKVADNSSLANFQSWVSFIWTAMVTTLGWVQTADTGQAANPPAAVPTNAYVYQIFKANDAAAATTPIYIKIECGFSTSNLQIRITVGGGSDGAGNITAPVIGPYIITDGAGNLPNQGGSTFNCYISGDAGEARVMMWQTSSTAETIFGIERSKDTGGAKTTDYATFIAMNAAQTSGWIQQSMYTGVSTPSPKELNLMTFVSTSVSPQTEFWSATGKTAANPIVPLVGFPGNQMLGFCSAAAADVAESNGVTITVNIYGGSHAYLATKQNNLNQIGRLTVSGGTGALLMRYE